MYLEQNTDEPGFIILDLEKISRLINLRVIMLI